jgi:Phosphotransferase system cellobiose-specific component IIB
MIKITLVCAAGMSTSMLVNKMEIAAKNMGTEVEIRAVSESSFKEYEKDTDILLLAPQVGFTFKRMQSEYEPKGIKVSKIKSVDYGRMNGENVLKDALELLK